MTGTKNLYYSLITIDGNSFQGVSIDSVAVLAATTLIDLRSAILLKNRQVLAGFQEYDLTVFLDQIQFGEMNPLQLKDCVSLDCGSETDPLLVLVPEKVIEAQSDPKEVLDLVIVGAGPHALGLVCHLMERSPFDIISDPDHQKLHFLNGRKEKAKIGVSFETRCPIHDQLLSNQEKRILVIDGHGSWMTRWDNSFHAYNIKHLRSPIFFHPDPFDPNALRAFAETEERLCELHDMTHIVDGCRKCKKKQARNTIKENDRNQFFAPSQALFSDFCKSLVDRYYLHDLVTKGWVLDIVPLDDDVYGEIFRIDYKTIVKLQDKKSGCCAEGHGVILKIVFKSVYARRCVGALGNTNSPVIPKVICQLPKESYPPSRIVHAIELANKEKLPIPADLDPAHLPSCKLLVIGGGLTSAQLVDLGNKYGFEKIVLATRSKIKIKPFDIDLEWIGRNNFRHYASFWQQDCAGRRQIIMQARNGGSMTSEYYNLIQDLERQKRLEIRQSVTLSSLEWTSDKSWKVCFTGSEEVEYFDLIWLGTGSSLDLRNESCLKNLVASHPTQLCGGLPHLNDDLKWPGLNFYLMSGYSGLSIGPSAGNLAGGRFASQKIARDIWNGWCKELACEFKGLELEDPVDSKPDLKSLATMTGSFVNYWDAIAIEN